MNDSPLLQCIYWCAKEAVYKLVEEKGVDFRKQIEVIAFDPQQITFHARFLTGNQERIYLLQYINFNDHCMVWVCGDHVL